MRVGAGVCDVCGERAEERWAFLVQVKNIGVGVGERATVLTNVAAAHCDGCARYFDVFRRRRLAAIATMVLAMLAFAPVMGLAGGFAGPGAGFVALAIVAVPVIVMLARVARWHDALRGALGRELLDDLARGLPHAPGVLEWREVRVFPGRPSDIEIHHTLRALRDRAARVRRLPN